MTNPAAPARPLLQFSLQGLMVVMAAIAIVLAVYRQSGWRPLVYYYFLLYLVGPWFAYLFCECLPIRARGLRLLLGNLLLMGLFLGAVQLAEIFFEAAAILLVGVGALVLWAPQYLVFFVWRQNFEE